MGTQSRKGAGGRKSKFGKRGANREFISLAQREDRGREDSDCRQVRGTHAAPTRLEQPGGRRPRSHSISSLGGPQRLPRPLPSPSSTLAYAPWRYPSKLPSQIAHTQPH